jgi:hypothetical protein
MSNYLQRIAESGGRTSSVAKPPAVSRGPIPAVGPLPSTAAGDDAFQSLGISAAPAATTHPSKIDEPERLLPEYSPREPGENVNAGSGDSAPRPISSRRIGVHPPSQIAVRAPEALRASISAVPRQPSIHKLAAEAVRTYVPSKPAPGTQRQNPDRSGIRISTPETGHPFPVHRQISSAGPIGPPNRSQAIPSQGNSPVPGSGTSLPPAELMDATIVASEPVPATVHSGTPVSPAHSKLPGTRSERDLNASAGMKPLTELPVTQILRPPVGHPSESPGPRLSAQTPDSRRRSQVSIGRIDVQVNNEAPPPSTPAPSRAGARMNSFQQRYLGRFLFNF